MANLHDQSSFYDKSTFDRYGTKLQVKKEKDMRQASRLSGKLIINDQNITAAVRGKRITGEVKESKFKVEQENGSYKIRVQGKNKNYLKKMGKDIKFDTPEEAENFIRREERNRLKDTAKEESAALHRRIVRASRVEGMVKKSLDEMLGEPREKDLGIEAIERIENSTKRGRMRLAEIAFKPESQKRMERLNKLSAREKRLQKQSQRADKKAAMSQFFSDAHENEAAVMYAMTKDKTARQDALSGTSTRLKIFDADNNSVVRNIEKNKLLIAKEMQKKSNQRRYAKAVRNNMATQNTIELRRRRIVQANHGRAKKIMEEIKKKSKSTKRVVGGSGCLSIFIIMLALPLFLLFFIGRIFANYTVDTMYQSDIINMTDISDYFTQKEIDMVMDILDSHDNPEIYDEYVYLYNGADVGDEKGLADAYLADGQANQVKYMSFIATMIQDFTLENSEDLLLMLFNKMYKIETYTETIEGEPCSCGCKSGSPCTCGACSDEPDKTVFTYELKVKDIDTAVNELYAELLPSQDRIDNAKAAYQLFQLTRGSQANFGNPMVFNWYNENGPNSHISSYNGYRIRTDGGGYDVEYHKGLDLPAPEGFVIVAPRKCTVIEAGYSDSMGKYVIMQTEDDVIIRYMHCLELYVQEGDVKKRNYKVAQVGSTGDSTGPHLHVDIQVKGNDGNYHYVNPLFFLSDEPYQID